MPGHWSVGLCSLFAAIPTWLSIITVQAIIGHPVPGHFLLNLFWCVLAVCLVLTAIGGLLFVSPRVQPPVELRRVTSNRIASYLPPRLKEAKIEALSAEDHYVRIHTNRGTHLVLMRFGDAVALMPRNEGARIHRSWWIAANAVTGIVRNKRSAIIQLETGTEARASRTGLAELKRLGFRLQDQQKSVELNRQQK